VFSCKSLSVLSTFFIIAISTASRCFAGANLVIENSPQMIPEGDIRAKLHGVSTVTTSPMFLKSASSGVTIPTDVVVAAVKTAPKLRKALNLPDDPRNISFPDIVYATKSANKEAAYVSTRSYDGIMGVYCGVPRGDTEASWKHLTCDNTASYNSDVITKLLLFGGLDTSNTIVHDVGGTNVALVAVKPSFAEAMIMGNETVGRLKTLIDDKGSHVLDNWGDVDKVITGAYSDNVKRVAFLSDNSVTFGAPYVETSAEAKLKLPKHISDSFDVYLLHLAMTWRELPRNQVDELNYYVVLPNDEIALSLMPLRYGIEVTEGAKNQFSPSIEMDGAKVELGELYGRDVSFTYLKPTIQAYGLQESRFSWSMRDQAVQPGAEQFLCAVGVPKHSRQLNLIMSASAHWSGVYAVAGGIETTDQIFRTVPLQ
jgi:hypothetical protein